LLVEATMIAPAAAPIAASRFVFFFVTTRGSEAVAVPLLVPLALPLDVDRRVEDEEVLRRVVALLAVFPDRITFVGAAAALVRSAAEIESNRAFWLACAASERSLLSAGSAGLSLLHAAAIASAGARKIVLSEVRIGSPKVVGSRRYSW
jgi:hypothetical protein